MRLGSLLPILSVLFIQGSSGQTGSGTSRLSMDDAYAPFYHGVASGDPLSDRVILWTRITPETEPQGDIQLTWQVASDTGMTQIVNSGTASTNVSKDYTVKVDATGLQPDTWYYYRFESDGKKSIRGRTKTAAISTDRLRFAVVSCSDYQNGYFNAYARIRARNDIDAVIHLGDYIYEYEIQGNLADRKHEPETEIVSLEDYRMRYSQYRLDNDLRELHRQFPFVCVWDDHESTNNSWSGGAENHQANEGSWDDRKANSSQAYFEWLPIRPLNETSRSIYRTIRYGNLMDLIMLDTRIEGRQVQGGSATAPDRTILGPTQYQWLTEQLQSSTATWKVIGQQVMMAPLKAFGITVNNDQWDGYETERTKLYNFIMDNNIQNVVVLTGDIHTTWACDLPMAGYNAQTGANSAGVEFVTTSITSGNASFLAAIENLGSGLVTSQNPHIKFVNLTRHGYTILDVTNEKTQGDVFFVKTITERSTEDEFADAHFVNVGERFLRAATTPTPSPDVLPVPAPALDGTVSRDDKRSVVVSANPNPFHDLLGVQVWLRRPGFVRLSLRDVTGKTVWSQQADNQPAGLAELR